jgi:hypothetical protein
MAEDIPQYTQDTEEEDNQSLFTSVLKGSLLYTEDWELSNDNTKLNSETSTNAPNEHSRIRNLLPSVLLLLIPLLARLLRIKISNKLLKLVSLKNNQHLPL